MRTCIFWSLKMCYFDELCICFVLIHLQHVFRRLSKQNWACFSGRAYSGFFDQLQMLQQFFMLFLNSIDYELFAKLTSWYSSVKSSGTGLAQTTQSQNLPLNLASPPKRPPMATPSPPASAKNRWILARVQAGKMTLIIFLSLILGAKNRNPSSQQHTSSRRQSQFIRRQAGMYKGELGGKLSFSTRFSRDQVWGELWGGGCGFGGLSRGRMFIRPVLLQKGGWGCGLCDYLSIYKLLTIHYKYDIDYQKQ